MRGFYFHFVFWFALQFAIECVANFVHSYRTLICYLRLIHI